MVVFDLAWSLYRRGFVFLVLASLFAAVVEVVIVYASLVLGVNGAIGVHSAGAGTGTSVFGGMATIGAGLLLSQLIALVLHGGMMKMVIDSGRTGERMDFTSLFAGFTRFLSYLGLWGITTIAVPLVMFLVFGAAVRILGPLALLLAFAMGLFAIWLEVCWLYGLPLIADQGLGPIAALSRSRDMVRRNGWWTTFLPLLLLGIAAWFVTAVISVAAIRSGTVRYVNVGVVEVLAMPFMICFVASMYMGGERRTPAPSQGSWPSYPAGPGYYGPPAAPMAPVPYPPEPPAYGAPAYGSPTYAPSAYEQQRYSPPAYEPVTYGPPPVPNAPAPLDPSREADAWATAADPLAGMPPRNPA